MGLADSGPLARSSRARWAWLRSGAHAHDLPVRMDSLTCLCCVGSGAAADRPAPGRSGRAELATTPPHCCSCCHAVLR